MDVKFPAHAGMPSENAGSATYYAFIPRDTDPEAFDIQLEIWRKLEPSKRMLQICRLCDQVREWVVAGIRDRHPEYSPDQVKHAAFRIFLGDETYREVWPDRELLAS